MRQVSSEWRNRGLAMWSGRLLALILVLAGGMARATPDAGAWAFDLLARVEQWQSGGPLDFLSDPTKNQPIPTAAQARIQASYGRLPMHFEPNLGQSADEVKFVARGAGYTLFLTADEAVLALRPGRPASERADLPHRRRFDLTAMTHDETPAIPGAVIRTRLEGATRNPAPQLEGVEKLPGISNYFLGNDPAKWRTNVPHYQRVRYPNVYPGIDLVYYGNPQRLEHDFIVAPGADPAAIQLAISGAEQATVNAEGDLVLKVPGGEVVQQAPRIYQVIDGRQQAVAGRYVLREATPGAAPTVSVAAAEPAPQPLLVGFEVAQYDPNQPLVIDPVLVYSTYLGGSSDNDWGQAIAVDGSGNAYVTGATELLDFPTINALQPNLHGLSDAFIIKLSGDGQTVRYSTYLGGADTDLGNDIAVDGSGNAYVTGWTRSPDFPTINALQPNRYGSSDAFIIKLSGDGQTVRYSTYLGGRDPNDDVGSGIAVDGSGNTYVTGRTSSPDFPTINALQPNLHGLNDAFIAKIADDGEMDVLDGRHFRTGAVISTDPSVLGDLSKNKSMNGAAADGEARLLLRARTAQAGSVTFSIPAGDGQLIHYQGTSSGSSVTVPTVLVNGQLMAFAIYRAPEQFPRAGHQEDESVARRQTTLTVNGPGGWTLNRDLVLERPPVVLIHGLFDNSDTWQTFAEKLKSRIAGIDPDLFYGDYRYNNTAHFSTNRLIPRAAVIAARNNYRNRGLAVVQADVFGHSMGGILGRIWAGDSEYRKDKNYGAGDFNKLIAVDASHTGSPWANLGWSVWNDAGVRDVFATLLGMSTDLGALEDLRTGTDNPALAAMNGQSPDVPGHVIVGNYVPTVDDLADLTCLANSTIQQPYIGAFCQAWKLFKFFGYDTSISLHFPVGSDLVVGTSSQRDGFGASSSQVSEYSHIHMKFADRPAALETDEVVDEAADLLNAAPDDSPFGHFGNGYTQASAMKLSRSSMQPLIRLAAAGTGIQITNPANSSTVAPGQTVTVTVQPDAGLTLDSLALIVPGDVQQRTAAPWTFSVTIPASAVGPFGIAAAGKDTGGTFYIAEITVNVAPTVALRALATTPTDVVLTEAGLQQSLVVQGIYQDDSVRDLTAATTGTTYQSSNPGVVTVDANGRLTAQSNGTATVAAINGEVSAYVTVRVEAETDLAISQIDAPDPLGADGRVTYTVTVQNQGTQRALDVQVYDTLPAGATLVEAAGPDWTCIEADGTVTCSRDALDTGATATIDLSVKVSLPCGVITNQATVNASTDDGDVDNNVSIATTSCSVQTYTLTVAKAGTGNGTVTSDPAGIDCGATCAANFDSGASVSLTATPATGSTFAGWSPASCGSLFTLTADTTCTATFNLINQPPTANAGDDQTVLKGGLVTLSGSGSDPDNGPSPLTFSWTQSGGPTVSLAGANTAMPTFTANEVGTYTFTLTVSDGQASASDEVVIKVVYGFTGFFPPVDNPPVLNTAKAGSAIPVKFSLGGDQGLAIFQVNSPASQPITCESSAPTDALEETATASTSGLHYDPVTDTYNYVWKTDKAWTGTCRQLNVKLIDGTSHTALFKFTK